MANLKEVRTRISSVKSTQQITGAMKMVSAAKLKRAQNAILKMRPYASKMQEILGNLVTGVEEFSDNPYIRETEKPQKFLIVPITGNKGLCGSFNSNVIKQVNRLLTNDLSEANQEGNVHLYCIGKKGHDFFRKKNANITGFCNDIILTPTFELSVDISKFIMNAFASKEYDEVYIVYNHFKNAATQTLTLNKFLPVQIEVEEKEKDISKEIDYILLPDKEVIINEIIPKSLRVQFFKIILESIASEHGARMTAMHKATDNAGELLKDLKLAYNNARQALITNEILEIVSGAEALKG